jgi:hypothetical protein
MQYHCIVQMHAQPFYKSWQAPFTTSVKEGKASCLINDKPAHSDTSNWKSSASEVALNAGLEPLWPAGTEVHTFDLLFVPGALAVARCSSWAL